MIKDDQGGTRNPYKCMNVMKQDATDDNMTNISLNKKRKCQAHKSQTHTQTLNKSNQFYISKISQDNLVSIH